MDATGVDGAILVPPRIEGGRNDLSLEAARLYPERFAVMGKLDQEAPDAHEKLVTWREQAGMLGVRFNVEIAFGPLLTEGRLDWVWPVAERVGVPHDRP